MSSAPAMHQLLRRQLKKHAPFSPDAVPPEWLSFCEAVSEAYDQYESDHRLIERTLDLSSAELNATNRMIEQQKLELERSNTELEHFAYIASHDLQEPLRMIMSYVQIIQKNVEAGKTDGLHEFMNYVLEGTGRMQALINDLLQFSRVTRKGNPFGETDMNEVLKISVAHLTARIAENNATVLFGQMPKLQGDSMQLIRLFQKTPFYPFSHFLLNRQI